MLQRDELVPGKVTTGRAIALWALSAPGPLCPLLCVPACPGPFTAWGLLSVVLARREPFWDWTQALRSKSWLPSLYPGPLPPYSFSSSLFSSLAVLLMCPHEGQVSLACGFDPQGQCWVSFWKASTPPCEWLYQKLVLHGAFLRTNSPAAGPAELGRRL